MKTNTVYNFHENYIKNTEQGAIVINKVLFICHLTQAVVKGCNLACRAVYINTRVLKHMYDKKPAEEYDFVISNLHKVVRHPTHIYQNRDAKRGDLCFVKQMNGNMYLCAIELHKNGNLKIVTAFRVRKQSYLNNYKLLWSWRDDIPSS